MHIPGCRSKEENVSASKVDEKISTLPGVQEMKPSMSSTMEEQGNSNFQSLKVLAEPNTLFSNKGKGEAVDAREERFKDLQRKRLSTREWRKSQVLHAKWSESNLKFFVYDRIKNGKFPKSGDADFDKMRRLALEELDLRKENFERINVERDQFFDELCDLEDKTFLELSEKDRMIAKLQETIMQ